MTVAALITGAVAGVAMGYVLQRGQLCFHTLIAGAWGGQFRLLRGWALGVSIAAVGLGVLYATPLGDGLSHGLAFRPVANVVGGVIIGYGMAVARSCVSGLLYKLGEGMLGAAVGIGGWIAGELVASRFRLPGPTVLSGGDAGTVPGVLGVPRLLVAVPLLAVVVALLVRTRGAARPPSRAWDWPRLGVALGLVIVLGWLLARLGGVSFGPSTVGASAGIAAGHPNWWLIAFLVGIVVGGALAARRTGATRVRGETGVRYVQLVAGGFLLGAGGWIAGGCNLGHGLSGLAQLNVSSIVVVAAMALGIGHVRAMTRPERRAPVPS